MHSPWVLKLSHIIIMFTGVICRGTFFHAGSQFSVWPAPRITQCHEFSSCGSGSGLSGYILCVLALANLQFVHPYRVLLKAVVNIRHEESIYSSAPGMEFIYSGAPDKKLIYSGVHDNTWGQITKLLSSIYIRTSAVIWPASLMACHEYHPPQLCATCWTIFAVILLHLI